MWHWFTLSKGKEISLRRASKANRSWACFLVINMASLSIVFHAGSSLLHFPSAVKQMHNDWRELGTTALKQNFQQAVYAGTHCASSF